MNLGGLFHSSEGRLSPFCNRKVKDSSLSRKFRSVCVIRLLTHAGVSGRLMDGQSELDGL